MKYQKSEAKEHAREHLVGVWAANLTPFDAQGQLDEAAYRDNLRHWIRDLQLGGLFIAGKQAEFFSMSMHDRKKLMEIAVDEARLAGNRGGVGPCGIITSCSDTNLDTVLELAQHSQDIGADYIIVHSPVLHFGADTDETIYEYYRYLSEKVNLGMAMWNHPDCGYTMPLRAKCATVWSPCAKPSKPANPKASRRRMPNAGKNIWASMVAWCVARCFSSPMQSGQTWPRLLRKAA